MPKKMFVCIATENTQTLRSYSKQQLLDALKNKLRNNSSSVRSNPSSLDYPKTLSDISAHFDKAKGSVNPYQDAAPMGTLVVPSNNLTQANSNVPNNSALQSINVMPKIISKVYASIYVELVLPDNFNGLSHNPPALYFKEGPTAQLKDGVQLGNVFIECNGSLYVAPYDDNYYKLDAAISGPKQYEELDDPVYFEAIPPEDAVVLTYTAAAMTEINKLNPEAKKQVLERLYDQRTILGIMNAERGKSKWPDPMTRYEFHGYKPATDIYYAKKNALLAKEPPVKRLVTERRFILNVLSYLANKTPSLEIIKQDIDQYQKYWDMDYNYEESKYTVADMLQAFDVIKDGRFISYQDFVSSANTPPTKEWITKIDKSCKYWPNDVTVVTQLAKFYWNYANSSSEQEISNYRNKAIALLEKQYSRETEEERRQRKEGNKQLPPSVQEKKKESDLTIMALLVQYYLQSSEGINHPNLPQLLMDIATHQAFNISNPEIQRLMGILNTVPDYFSQIAGKILANQSFKKTKIISSVNKLFDTSFFNIQNHTLYQAIQAYIPAEEVLKDIASNKIPPANIVRKIADNQRYWGQLPADKRQIIDGFLSQHVTHYISFENFLANKSNFNQDTFRYYLENFLPYWPANDLAFIGGCIPENEPGPYRKQIFDIIRKHSKPTLLTQVNNHELRYAVLGCYYYKGKPIDELSKLVLSFIQTSLQPLNSMATLRGITNYLLTPVEGNNSEYNNYFKNNPALVKSVLLKVWGELATWNDFYLKQEAENYLAQLNTLNLGNSAVNQQSTVALSPQQTEKAEIEALKKKHEAIVAENAKLHALLIKVKKNIPVIDAEYKKNQQALADKAQALTEAEKANVKLRAEVVEKEEVIKRLMQDIEAVNKQLVQLNKEYQENKKALEEQLAKISHGFEQEKAALKTEFAKQTEATKQAAQEGVEQLQKALEAEKQSLKKQIENISQAAEENKKALQLRIEQSNAEIAQLEKTLAAEKQQSQQLSEAVNTKEKALQQQIEISKSAKAEKKALQARLAKTFPLTGGSIGLAFGSSAGIAIWLVLLLVGIFSPAAGLLLLAGSAAAIVLGGAVIGFGIGMAIERLAVNSNAMHTAIPATSVNQPVNGSNAQLDDRVYPNPVYSKNEKQGSQNQAGTVNNITSHRVTNGH